MMRPTASQTLEFLFLENPQQLGLQRPRNITDLVQEERSLVSELEPADSLCDSSSKSSLLMAKELALQQI